MWKENISAEWKNYFSIKRNKYEFTISLILLLIVLFALTRFLLFVENREGASLNDPLLKLISSVDFTWLTFLIIYAALAAGLFFLLENPGRLLLGIQTYFVMVVFRIIAMYFLPLNPPEGMIPLVDPFVEIFGTGQLLTRDLFFSGHTATIFIFYLTIGKKKIKSAFLYCTVIIGVLVLIQHVHYTIDVLASPFFTYTAYMIVNNYQEQKTSMVI